MGYFMSTTSSILSVNYYDNYDFLGNFAHGNDSLSYRLMTGYDSRYIGPIAAQSAKGYLTGTATRVLGDSIMLVKSLYYDSHGNVIQSHENNAVGGYEHEYLHLTFTGKPLAVRHEHGTIVEHNDYYPYGGLINAGDVTAVYHIILGQN